MNLRTIRQTAAHLLAASVYELFPSVEVFLAQATDRGFVCSLYFPHPIHPDTLPLFERRMKEIIREKRPIRTLEMVPVSAAALLEKEGQISQAESLDGEEEIVEVIEMGSYHGLSEGPHLKNTAQIGAFKLLSLEQRGEGNIWIEGVAAESKEELKKFLKKLAAYQEISHQTLGKKKSFWEKCSEGWIWYSEGLRAKEVIRELFFEGSLLIETTGFQEEQSLFSRLAQERAKTFRRWISSTPPIEDLYSSEARIQKISTPLPENFSEEAISSLQSILKTLIILDFECRTSLVGKSRDPGWKTFSDRLKKEMGISLEQGGISQVEVIVKDPLDRPQLVACLRKDKNSLVCEAFVERILALLLERNIGILAELAQRKKTGTKLEN